LVEDCDFLILKDDNFNIKVISVTNQWTWAHHFILCVGVHLWLVKILARGICMQEIGAQTHTCFCLLPSMSLDCVHTLIPLSRRNYNDTVCYIVHMCNVKITQLFLTIYIISVLSHRKFCTEDCTRQTATACSRGWSLDPGKWFCRLCSFIQF